MSLFYEFYCKYMNKNTKSNRILTFSKQAIKAKLKKQVFNIFHNVFKIIFFV